jgi:cytochrome c oxidase subunit II
MQLQVYVGIVFLLMALALAAVFLFVAREAQTEPYEVVSRRGALIRRWWFRALLVGGAAAFLGSTTWLPYRMIRATELPGEPVRVDVTARQFVFELSQSCVPSRTPVEFAVGAADVNHGFGIYAPDGRLVGQVQAMPGFVNVLRTRFETEGTYLIHCLELCGLAHHAMAAGLKVVGCG